jgi:hypothetical protein
MLYDVFKYERGSTWLLIDNEVEADEAEDAILKTALRYTGDRRGTWEAYATSDAATMQLRS